MFGLQRVGDLTWAAGEMRTRGFLIGATAGRTTLNGEGLQHQDGHSHVLAHALPNLRAYDPAYAYELAVIMRHGIERMYADGEEVFYYLTVENQPYAMPSMPPDSEAGILKGMYRLRQASQPAQVHLLASGPILNEAVKAQELLATDFDITADVWSITSFKELYRDGQAAECWNLLHPDQMHPDQTPKIPYIGQCLAGAQGAFVTAPTI